MNDKVLKILLDMDKEQLYLMFDYAIRNIKDNENKHNGNMELSKYYEESERKLFKTILHMRQLMEFEN